MEIQNSIIGLDGNLINTITTMDLVIFTKKKIIIIIYLTVPNDITFIT